MSKREYWRAPLLLWIAFGVGIVLRFLAAGYQGISHDAAAFYLPNAQALFEGGLGNWQGMTIAIPPLFPTLVASLAHLFPGEGVDALEWAALWISIVAGAAIIWPVRDLARQFFPSEESVPRWSVVLAAIHPFLVQFGGDARADSLYTLFFTTAVTFGWRTYRRPGARG